MEQQRQQVSFSQQFLHSWDPIFDSRVDISAGDVPRADGMNDVNAAGGVLEGFMQALNQNDTCQYETDDVVRFCGNATIQDLGQCAPATKESIALLEQSDEQGRSRGNDYGLTARDLCLARRKPRWNSATENTRPVKDLESTNGEDEAEKELDDEEDESADEPDADIRRLYIPTPNRWAYLALAASASWNEAPALAEFMYQHLQSDALITARTVPAILPTFALQFHLTYYVLRTHKSPFQDHRESRPGKPLRRMLADLTHLTTMAEKTDNSPNEYIYETRTSGMTSGTSVFTWDACVFDDLYYEDPEDALGSIEDYVDQKLGGISPDPLTLGMRMAGGVSDKKDVTVREPRAYFAIMFEPHIRRVRKEWHQTVAGIERTVDTYMKSYNAKHVQLNSGAVNGKGPLPLLGDERVKLRAREEHQVWVESMKEILNTLIHALTGPITEWEVFGQKGANYYSDNRLMERLSRHPWRSLARIDDEFLDLKRLLKRLEVVEGRCKQISRDLNNRIMHESNEAAKDQQRSTGEMKKVASITYFLLPLVLVSAMLSMQEGYLPPIQSPWVPLGLVGILEVCFCLQPIINRIERGWIWLRAFVGSKHHVMPVRKEHVLDVEQDRKGLG